MTRWVRIQASILDHPLFANAERSESEAWLWLITNAAWAPTRHRIGSEVVDVPVGSLFVTLRGLAKEWGWKSDKRVRTFLKTLETHEMVETKTDAGKTHITVCNYSRYQNSGRTEDASGTQDGRSADAQKIPEHQNTNNTSSLRSDVRPEPQAAPASPTVIELPATQGHSVSVTEADVSEWAGAFPAVDVHQKLKAIRQWLIANPQKRKTPRGMKRFVVSWLSREQDKGGHLTTGPPRRETEFARHQRECTEALERSVYGDRNGKPAGNAADIELEPGNWRAH